MKKLFTAFFCFCFRSVRELLVNLNSYCVAILTVRILIESNWEFSLQFKRQNSGNYKNWSKIATNLSFDNDLENFPMLKKSWSFSSLEEQN